MISKPFQGGQTAMRVLISAEQIHERVQELAQQVAAVYREEPVTLVGILSGSLIFLADLCRQLRMPTRIGFIHASSYRGETTTPGRLRILHHAIPEVRGRHMLVVDDILDSGQTLASILDQLRTLQPKTLRVAVLLRKRERQRIPLEPDFCGFEIPDLFVVGYGLDYNDDYRQLPYIAVLPDGGPAVAAPPA